MKKLFLYIILFTLISCDDNFLERYPLSQSSSETFWTSDENAEMWVNYIYNGLPNAGSIDRETWSDNAIYRPSPTGVIANGTHEPTSTIVSGEWDYTTIRRCLEFLENIEQVPNITQSRKDGLTGQVRFILSYKYFELITLFRDVPLVTKPLTVLESDIPKSPKAEVLSYILEQLNYSIDELPTTWPSGETGRITKGAALALKARVLLYNEKWAEAASAAKQVMDLNIYKLHPNFGELFVRAFNNKTEEVILAYQYAETVKEHDMIRRLDIILNGGFSLILPLGDLINSFECNDGLSISESQVFDSANPFSNRDPRFYETFILPYQTFADFYYDPLQGQNMVASVTYLHFRKYINDKVKGETHTHVNWILFRYAEVLLTYAEAKNEVSGPDNSIYDALDLIRLRAEMPAVDREKYNTKEKLRNLIRNERRVELAAEGLRYFDIIRWKIAENELNKIVTSAEIPGVLPLREVETRVFDPNKHYVWPIPQSALDKAKKLEQHPEWK